MAMITIERMAPSKNNSVQNQDQVLNTENNNNNNEEPNNNNNSSSSTTNHLANTENNNNRMRSNSEIYIAVRGADIIFPHNECHRYFKSPHSNIIGDHVQKHLQAILNILRYQDKMKMAVRLESQLSDGTRYLLVVSNETDQCCLLGIDCENDATIGLVLPIWTDMQITLDGDGGFRITTGNRHHIFKPVSVQAMWSIFQALHLARKKSIKNNYYAGGGSHEWVVYYKNNIKSNRRCLHEWHTIVTDQTETNHNKLREFIKPKDNKNFEEVITIKLKEVMASVDLEQVTSKEIRNKLEEHFQRDLSEYKSYIDSEMIRIMGQLEEPSKILDYLYLGSEWNASNLEDLKDKGVQKILNVTSEIDNYFPGSFDYYNIRVDDDEATNMLPHLNETYYYIRKAKDEGVKVLVHCKKGISRSASVVVAYIMKEKSYDLNEALQYVRNHRSTIRPNPAFLEQLEIYQGMLHASNNKNNVMWKSNSDSELQTTKCKNFDESDMNNGNKKKCLKQSKRKEDKENTFKFQRRKSWPPKDVLFRHKETNKMENPRSDSFCYLDDKGFTNYNVLQKFEIKSRVKERIEDFENKQPTNQTKNFNLFKKNIAKNGLVSNLACQFEPKETMNDISNVDSQQQPQRLMKPPIPPTTTAKLSKEYQQLDHQPKYHTINLSRCLLNQEYSNRMFKRALSCDFLNPNIQSNDNSLKKCKKSFLSTKCNFTDEQQRQVLKTNMKNDDNNNNVCGQLYRTCSLPNIVINFGLARKRIFDEEKNLSKQSNTPLDLQFINNQNNDCDGFVKKRTEELENRHQSMSIMSNSMPSSPNLLSEQTSQRKTFINQVKLSESFNCPSSYKKQTSSSLGERQQSDEKTQTARNVHLIDRDMKKLKKTYGKSHPLDKLNRDST